jgi:hypothetical protein
MSDWEIGEERTVQLTEPLDLFCPQYFGAVHHEALSPEQAGLHRVRVQTRGRTAAEEDPEAPPEEFLISYWPSAVEEPSVRVSRECRRNLKTDPRAATEN